MPRSLSVDEVAEAIKRMSRWERQLLLSKIADMEELLEELSDIADVIRSRHEDTRPYEEFLAELSRERGYNHESGEARRLAEE